MTRLSILAVFVVTASSGDAALPAVVAANNFDANGGIGAPIFYLKPGMLAPVGQSIFVEILAGPLGGELAPATNSDGGTFMSIGDHGAGSGFFDGGEVFVPGVAGGSEAQFQVRVWQGTNGFANARQKVASPVWTQATGSWTEYPPLQPGVPPGLQIPVPSLLISNVQASLNLGLVPKLTVTGIAGQTYALQYATNLTEAVTWTTLTNLTLTMPVQVWYDFDTDATLPDKPQRFYRVVAGPP